MAPSHLEAINNLPFFATFFDGFFSRLSSSFFGWLSGSFLSSWFSSGFGFGEDEGRLLGATIYDVLEFFTSAESRNASSRNFQRGEGSGVTASAGFAHTTLKGTEANESDFVAFGESASYGMNES
jgi:hypothetical protein